MRLHRLELTAFGPFPGTEVVDLDRLNEAGLFLLTGPTGAGKTSILDAICFALYGGVPGSRNGAKSFKSDHADGDTVPSVELELTVRDRRFRLRRQPGWQRPSRRAKAGYVDERTKASIEELVDASWRVHSTRVDEVGHLVSTLLGMNMAQFCQVVMLPQGEFQTFLGAGAKERHDVLESLFHTHRFQAIERWLADHRRSLDVACHEAEAGLDQLLARTAEVSTGVDGLVTATRPETSEQGDADYLDLITAFEGRSADLVSAATSAAEAQVTAAESAKQAQHALDTARTLLELQRRHRDALNRRDELVSAATEVRRREREVLLAQRAGAFEPLLELVSEADRTLHEAHGAVEDALEQVWRPTRQHDLSTQDATTAQVHELTQQLARLEALVGVQEELDGLQAELVTLDVELSSARVEEVELDAALAELPEQLDVAHQRRAAGLSAHDLVAAVDHEVRIAKDRCDAARQVAARTVEIDDLDATLLSARERRVVAREAAQDVRERRIAGMAAELAAQLRPGAACPVCGSADHPQPAMRVDGASDADDESAAFAVLDETELSVAQLTQRRERLSTQRAAADRASSGHTIEQAEAELAVVLGRRDVVTTTAADLPAANTHLADLEAGQIDLRRRLEVVRRIVHIG
ncbi:MAG: SMC family ATPase, partial [Nocardioidaceae bacterium]